MITLLKFWREGLIVVLLLGLAWQQTRVSNEKADHQRTKTQHAEVLRDLADKTLKVYRAAVADDEARKKVLAALDAKHTKELNDEKANLEKLRADVAAGRVGLRVNAVCTPAAGTDVPQATGATSVADAAGPRLDDAAERDYFTLRERIETVTNQLTGLQAYVREQCLN